MDDAVRLRLIGLLEQLLDEQASADRGGPAVATAPLAELADPAALRIYPDSRTVLLGMTEIALTRREFDLLYCLASRPRQVFTRAQLLDRVWGHHRSGPRSIDVHVRRLRRKLGDDLPVVRTVHGVGYRLDGAVPVVVLRTGESDSGFYLSAEQVPTR
jgi:DNA-binding response OmpR family regulator